MLQSTQELFAEIPPKCPKEDRDKRHQKAARRPFVEYDVLSDDEIDEWILLVLSHVDRHAMHRERQN